MQSPAPPTAPQTRPGYGRARPMPPDERRAMLIAATLPLVAEFGPKVTTRQIARAAGVAEGTIFRVFPDKEALLRAAIAQALDPAPILDELDAVDIALPLPQRVVQLTEILQRRLIMVFQLVIAVGLHASPDELDQHRRAARPQHALITEKIVGLLEPDSEQFRCPVPEVARLLRLLTFSGSHPMIADGRLLTAQEIASVVLDGVRRRTGPPTSCEDTVERGDHRC